MTLRLDYGTDGLRLDLSELSTTVLRPRYISGLADEADGFRQAVREPMGSPPLRELIRPGERVAVVIPDITRALPSDRLLPWLFSELGHVAPQHITIIIGTGTHRANTPEEIARMVGKDVAARFRIVNHDARDRSTLLSAGRSPFGYDVSFNRHYVQAERRILMGFIEPHFMAGFSGGYKAVFPGIADLEAIMHYHNFANIGHKRSTWGLTERNPTQDHVRAGGCLLPVDFLVNVTLNTDRAITRFFCGEVMQAHAAGCAYSRETAMAPVDVPFPIVVTTNSGYPLDMNLYQTVKGMSAAHAIVQPGGLIVTAARCNDGFPEHGAFKEQLMRWSSPEASWAAIADPSFSEPDQWQTQKLLQIVRTCRVALYSELDPDQVRRAHIDPVSDIRACIDAELYRLGQPNAPIAVLPEGPLTIPYVR